MVSPETVTTGRTLFTVIVNDLVSVKVGLASSATLMETVAVPGPSSGVQVKRPVSGSIAIPGRSPETMLYVRCRLSTSWADAWTDSPLPSLTDWAAIAASTGASFTGVTCSVTEVVSVRPAELTV